MGAALILALAGCSSSANDKDSNPIAGGGTTGGAQSGAGSTAVNPGTPTGGSTGMVGSTAGSNSQPSTGGSSPVAAGTGGNPSAGGSGGDTSAGGSGGIDTSGFMVACKQGGAQWGKPEQAGPCKSGTTIYGVTTDYGPYGAASEYNVGSGANGTDYAGAFPFGCTGFIDGFGADPVGSADLKDVHDLDFDKFTVFYPGAMPAGEKFPLIAWGNGTCAMPEGYGPLLRYVASFGYIIVAPNDLATSGGASMLKGLDFMLAENGRAESKYYQHIDPDKIGAMGHSQGAGATIAAASDPRIKAIIAWNGGSSPDKPFLNVSGDRDLGGTAAGNASDTNGKQQPGAYIWYHQIPQKVGPPPGSTTGTTAPGHLTLMMEPERVSEVAVAWWDMMLKGKEDAKKMFLGDACTLCSPTAFPSKWPPALADSPSTPSLEYGHNALLK